MGATSNQYGIHFDVGSAPQNGQYRMFRDDGSNTGWYDSGDVTLGALGNLDARYIIQDIVDSNNNSLAGTALSVTFVRPNFDALFRTSSGASVPGPVYIKVTPKDTSNYSAVPERLVEITSTGQISVK